MTLLECERFFELIKEDLTINSDNPMGSFKRRRNSQEFIKQIEENEKINLNHPIGYLDVWIQLAYSGQSETPKT